MDKLDYKSKLDDKKKKKAAKKVTGEDLEEEMDNFTDQLMESELKKTDNYADGLDDEEIDDFEEDGDDMDEEDDPELDGMDMEEPVEDFAEGDELDEFPVEGKLLRVVVLIF